MSFVSLWFIVVIIYNCVQLLASVIILQCQYKNLKGWNLVA